MTDFRHLTVKAITIDNNELFFNEQDDPCIYDIMSDDIQSELEMVEFFASENNMISNEDELARYLENMLLECVDFKARNELKNDDPAMSQFFNNYIDSMCSNGELHELQVNEYTNQIDL